MLKVHILEDGEVSAAKQFEYMLQAAILDKFEIRDLHYSVTSIDGVIAHSLMVVCFYADKEIQNPILDKAVKSAVKKAKKNIAKGK